MKQKNTWLNLGYANGWNEIPKELEQCRSKGHQMYRTYHSGVTTYYCDKCKIEYKVDSTG